MTTSAIAFAPSNAFTTLPGIGPAPLVPGRRVRAFYSTCKPAELREVILE